MLDEVEGAIAKSLFKRSKIFLVELNLGNLKKCVLTRTFNIFNFMAGELYIALTIAMLV